MKELINFILDCNKDLLNQLTYKVLNELRFAGPPNYLLHLKSGILILLSKFYNLPVTMSMKKMSRFSKMVIY